MSRTVRLTLLAMLSVLVAALQLRLVWSTLQFIPDASGVHALLPVDSQLRVEAEQGGLRKGDILLSVGSIRVGS